MNIHRIIIVEATGVTDWTSISLLYLIILEYMIQYSWLSQYDSRILK